MRKLPAGVRLEMHPMVYRHLLRDPRNTFGPWPEDLGKQLGVPVKITHELPDDSWRLAIVTEDVLTEGRL
jgi:hypothetical protein